MISLRKELSTLFSTAFAIAKSVNIAKSQKEIMTGSELNKLTDHELEKVINKYSVFARVTPEHKLKIVKALKSTGNVVAMTGDGVNDAPVIARCDVGIAMGALGSDAAIESADIVIANDKLDSLSRAQGYAKKTVQIARQNVAFSLAVKAAVLVLGAIGLANMWVAVFADVGVMVLAILNSLRMLALPKKEKAKAG